MSSGRRIRTYIGLALLGGAVGAIVGLLVAPASGDVTRRRISRRQLEEQDDLVHRRHLAFEGTTDYLEPAAYN